MKQLIAETGECSSTFFQKKLRIRRQKVSELMKKLVKEGWLQEPEGNGRGYRILLSQEEMTLKLKD